MSLIKEKLELEVEEAELIAQQQLLKFPPLLRWSLIGIILLLIPSYLTVKAVSHGIYSRQYSRHILSAKQSFSNPKDPVIRDTAITSTGNGTYSAVATVENNNLELSADQVPYRFDFFNSRRERLYSHTGKMYLLPGQTKYVVVPRITTNDAIDSSELVFTQPPAWQRRLSLPKINIVSPPPSTYNQSNPAAFVAEGTYTNNSPYRLSSVKLTVLLLDSKNEIIAATQRDDFTIQPYERRAYKLLWPNAYSTDVARTIVTAETDILNPSNLALPDNSKVPASDLSRPEGDRGF